MRAVKRIDPLNETLVALHKGRDSSFASLLKLRPINRTRILFPRKEKSSGSLLARGAVEKRAY